MSSIATFEAPSNIAFIKYWGTRDRDRTLPYNVSLSMTLSWCVSRCTVEHLPQGGELEILWRSASGSGNSDGPFEPAPAEFAAGIEQHLTRLARWAGASGSFRVATENSFPTGAGMASSASGFAALTLAATAALGHRPDRAEASILARSSGSGSAARSVLGGYVVWPGSDDPDAPAAQVAPAEHWELCDIVAVVDSSPKKVSSRRGHTLAATSPHWARRLELLPGRTEAARRAILDRSLAKLGPIIEEEAIELHVVAMTSAPPIFYWAPGTLAVLEAARELRSRGLEAYATIDAGPNVHLICEPAAKDDLVAELERMELVESVICDRVGPGPRELERHLIEAGP